MLDNVITKFGTESFHKIYSRLPRCVRPRGEPTIFTGQSLNDETHVRRPICAEIDHRFFFSLCSTMTVHSQSVQTRNIVLHYYDAIRARIGKVTIVLDPCSRNSHINTAYIITVHVRVVLVRTCVNVIQRRPRVCTRHGTHHIIHKFTVAQHWWIDCIAAVPGSSGELNFTRHLTASFPLA